MVFYFLSLPSPKPQSHSHRLYNPADSKNSEMFFIFYSKNIEQAGGAHCSIIEAPEWVARHLIKFLS